MNPRTTHRMVTFRAKVPIYLGYDPKFNIHYFHEEQTQEVELSGWYLLEDSGIELLYGTNLYTKGSMSHEWIKALEGNPEWYCRLANCAKTAYENA